MTAVMCSGTSGKQDEPCALEARYVDARGRVWCGVHADRTGCTHVPSGAMAGVVAYRRALQPQGGTVTDAELAALGSWAKPEREHRRAWAAHVRELLAASPGRDLASAALEARMTVQAPAKRRAA